MLYRKCIPSQSLAHGGDRGDKATALHAAIIKYVVFPDSFDCPGFQEKEEEDGGGEGQGTKKGLEKNWVSLPGDLLCHFGQILLYAVAALYSETPLKPLSLVILCLTFCKKPVCSEKPCIHTEQASCRRHCFKGNHTLNTTISIILPEGGASSTQLNSLSYSVLLLCSEVNCITF